MQIYLINLDSDTERLEWMRNQFDGHGLSWARVSGVDLRGRVGQEAIAQWAHLPRARLAPAEIGCMMSHAKCWQKIIESGAELGCVFEDDVVLSSALGQLLNEDSWIPRSLGIVRLETNNQICSISRRILSSRAGIDIKATFDNWQGTAGYVVTAQKARELLDGLEANGLPVDMYMNDPKPATVIYQMVPAPCRQGKWGDDSNGTQIFGSHIVGARSEHDQIHPDLIDYSAAKRRRSILIRAVTKLRRMFLKAKLKTQLQHVDFIE